MLFRQKRTPAASACSRARGRTGGRCRFRRPSHADAGEARAQRREGGLEATARPPRNPAVDAERFQLRKLGGQMGKLPPVSRTGACRRSRARIRCPCRAAPAAHAAVIGQAGDGGCVAGRAAGQAFAQEGGPAPLGGIGPQRNSSGASSRPSQRRMVPAPKGWPRVPGG
jgi:hypothetical protein